MKISKVKNENHVTIHGWMVNELKLKGNELFIYAIIYGFSQDGQSKFTGSLQYLADWTNSTKQGCLNNIKSLLAKNLILKEEKEINNVKLCEYYTNLEFVNTIKQSLIPIKKSLTPIKKSLTNNIDNNIDNKKTSKKKQKELEEEQLNIDLDIAIDNYSSNETIKELLQKYLAIRKIKGLTASQWYIILEDLKAECSTNIDYTIECIRKAIAGGWSQIVYPNTFAGKVKSTYSSKNNFDNTKNHEVSVGVAEMSVQERADYLKNELAKDENGNFLKF